MSVVDRGNWRCGLVCSTKPRKKRIVLASDGGYPESESKCALFEVMWYSALGWVFHSFLECVWTRNYISSLELVRTTLGNFNWRITLA